MEDGGGLHPHRLTPGLGAARNLLPGRGRHAQGRITTGAGMTLARIERWDVRCDGPLSEGALQRKIEALGFTVKARIYPAGAGTPAPAEDLHRIIGVVRGLVRLTIDDEQISLTAGDLAFIPRGAVRGVELVGQTPALCLEAVQRFEPTRLPAAEKLPDSAH